MWLVDGHAVIGEYQVCFNPSPLDPSPGVRGPPQGSRPHCAPMRGTNAQPPLPLLLCRVRLAPGMHSQHNTFIARQAVTDCAWSNKHYSYEDLLRHIGQAGYMEADLLKHHAPVLGFVCAAPLPL
jgi:hypothetical protein